MTKKRNRVKHFLDFEEPIAQLYEQLNQLHKTRANDSDIKEIENHIEEAKKTVYQNLSRWQKVQLSRHPARPYSLYYINEICDQFTELHGDRNFRDDKAIIGGLGSIKGKTYLFIGHQKGRDTKDRQFRNFGMAKPEGYRKALRLMKLAEKFDIPIVSFIDTPGAYPGIAAEERGQSEAIARNLIEMVQLRVPILSIVIGEGASGGALGIGLGDRLLMLENTWFSVISPESCSSILWGSWAHKEIAAEELKLTASDNYRFSIIDEIIKEPLGGAHYDPKYMAKLLKEKIILEIASLQKYHADERINRRIKKYEEMGEYGHQH